MWSLQLFVLCLTPALLPAVRINAKGRELIYLAKGDSVKLGCPYELEPQDHGPSGLDIEWTQLNSDPTNLDNVILSYHDQQVIHPGYHPMQQSGRSGIEGEAQRSARPNLQKKVVEGNSASEQLTPMGDSDSNLQQRVNFTLQDPSQNDASINLQNVQVFDTATYECKVKKTSVATRKVIVTVIERPSAPQCSIKGKIVVGHEVNLSCTSGTGTPPLLYQWSKVADYLQGNGNWLSSTTMKGIHPGDLVIRKLSQEHVGVYHCRVSNKVGSAQCTVEISLSEDSNQVTIVLGTVLGSLLVLLLVLCLILGLIYCRRKRSCKEEANQIRVDTAPPSRTRAERKNSSLPCILGYLPHNFSFIQHQKYEKPKEQESVEMLPASKNADLTSVVDSSSKVNKT